MIAPSILVRMNEPNIREQGSDRHDPISPGGDRGDRGLAPEARDPREGLLVPPPPTLPLKRRSPGSTEAEPGGEPQSIIELLRRFPSVRALVEGLDEQQVRDVEASLEWFGVAAGTILFYEGDPAADAFVLTFGQLGIFVGPETTPKMVAKISAGQLVGEMALVSDAPRSATVVALHDSDLVRLPRSTVDLLLQSNPEATRFMLRLLTSRLRSTSRRPTPAEGIEGIAIVPLGPVEHLAEALAWMARQVNPITFAAADEEDRWRHAAANDSRLFAYIADNHHSAWARHCIRQADRVIFVANADTGVVGRDAIAFARDLHRDADLVLVNRADSVLATGGTDWLNYFQGEHILHVRLGNEADYSRVLRLVSRSGICLVFSGGGARGFAHLGVLQALAEKGIPIDAVGGTSIGALVAGGVARGLSVDEVVAGIHHAFVENNPVHDFTLPFVSLSRGRKSNRLLHEGYGEALIENLWKTFFCVSANLATGSTVMHQSGLLWRALAASTAIPGIFPPVMEDRQVLVDGGIMDNFPTNSMRSLRRGQVIGVEVSSGTTISGADVEIPEKSLLWMALRGRRQVPSIVRILMCSGMVNSESQTAASRAATDVLIQPVLDGIDMMSFKAFDRAVEAGYRAALEAIPRLVVPAVVPLPSARSAA
jgi:NTE family protein